MGIVIIGFITGMFLLAVCGVVENRQKKRYSKLSLKEYRKLVKEGRLK